MSENPTIHGLFAATMASLSLSAQQALTVGPGQPFTTIQAAIAAAAPGDRIAVLAGNYPSFTLDRALTIHAEPNGAAVVVAAATVALPAGDHGRITGLEFDFLDSFSSGLLSLDRSIVRRGISIWGGELQMWRCQAVGGIPALRATDARIAMVQCELRGSDAWNYLQNPAAAVFLDCVVQASECRFFGGSQISPIGQFQAALVVGTTTFELADCQVVGGNWTGVVGSGVSLGHALWGAPQSVVHHRRCSFVGGPGPGGVAPAIVSGGQVLDAPVLGATIAETDLQLGGTLSATFRGEPGGAIAAIAALALRSPVAGPFFRPLQWGFGPADSVVVAFAPTGASGELHYTLAIPAVPALRGTGVWLTGVDFSVSPWPLSAPVGGVL